MAKPRKPRKSSHDFDSDKPWTEAQWQAFMKESDLKAARFGELLETLRNDPNCHEKVAEEMGWADDEDDDEDPELAGERSRWIEEMNEAGQEALRELEAEREADQRAGITPAQRTKLDQEREQSENPIYGAACQLTERVMDVLEPHMKKDASSTAADEDGEDDPLTDAYIGVMTAGAKLARVIDADDDDEQMLGNTVVCLRLALEATQKGKAGWEALPSRKILPAKVVEEMVAEHARVEKMIADRIAELRAKMWWDDNAKGR
jgi:hypothetical protein